MPQPLQDSAGVSLPPPLVFLGAMFIGLILQFIWSVSFLPWQLGMICGGIFLVAGLLFIGSAALLFMRAGTAMPPWQTATTVVTAGPYRFTRNPMYLGMALVHAGIGLWFASLWILLMLAPALWWIQTRVIAREEAYMAEKFGKPFRDYCSQVRRWL